MKKVSFLTACMMIIPFSIMSSQEQRAEVAQKDVNGVTITAAPEIEALVGLWVEGFERANPEMKVVVSPQGDASQKEGIHFVTGTSAIEAGSETAWRIVVGREVVVPVVNAANPLLNDILSKGISPEKFRALLASEERFTWGMILGDDGSVPANILILGDKTVQSSVSEFTGLGQSDIKGTVTSTSAALLEALQKDPGAIAFCRLADISDPVNQEILAGFKIIPVDVNSNGLSDYFEQFYSDYHSFNRGVYIGKYPKSLFNSIFAVSGTQYLTGTGIALLNYILLEGQPQLTVSGYTALAEGEGRMRSGTLASDQTLLVTAASDPKPIRAVLWLAALIAVVSALTYFIYRLNRSHKITDVIKESVRSEGFSEKSLIIPGGILFDKSHTWAFMEKDGSVRVGIDDFLQHITGRITRVRMKSSGQIVRKGEHIFSLVQKGKQLDICSPVTGTIVSRNESLNTSSDAINISPYGEGWVYTIEPDNWTRESRMMIMAGRYVEWIRDEFARIKDFITALPGVNEVRLAHVVLQDGGELRDGLLEEFGPDVWEEFQMKFIDLSR